MGYLLPLTIDHFHYDVTHAKVSGSCSKDRAQGHSIAGKFKIIHKNTCMQCNGARVGRSSMCTIKRTSTDISDKSAFAPLGHIKRQQCKSKEALFLQDFRFFFKLIVSHSVRYKTF